MDLRITRLLKRHHVLTLATTSPDGPWTAHCFYAYMPEHYALVFTSDPDTRHGRNMLANPQVAAGISLETKVIGKIRGLQLTGTARYCAPPLPRPQGARERGPGGEVVEAEGPPQRGPGGEVVPAQDPLPQGARAEAVTRHSSLVTSSGPGGEVVPAQDPLPQGARAEAVTRHSSLVTSSGPGGEAATAYLLRFPFALAVKLDLWILDIDYIKMTDNRLGFGKKLEWRKEEDLHQS